MKQERNQKILELHQLGKSQHTIARLAGCSRGTVSYVLRTENPNEKEKTIMSFAQKLAEFAKEAPDYSCRREVMQTVAFIRQNLAISNHAKKQKVANLIGEIPIDIAEIIEQTKMHREEIEKILEALEAEKVILSRTRGGIRNRGRKTVRLYFTNKEYKSCQK